MTTKEQRAVTDKEGTVFDFKTVLPKSNSLNTHLKFNSKQRKDGIVLLGRVADESIPLTFFDPQYRSILDKMKYGNEGEKRGRERSALQQMPVETIQQFIKEIERVLLPSGHLMLWVDKYILCSQLNTLIEKADKLSVVDMITWNKDRMGMGYRSRRHSEHLVILQKKPVKAKGIWSIHNIPDVWTEKITKKNHTHNKPVGLQARLIQATTQEGSVVIDPAAGGYSVMEACKNTNRVFLGCDINS